MDLAELHRRTVEGWAARVAAVPEDRWSAPTPCDDWTVRDLVNHVVGEDRWTGPLMRGATIAEVGDRFDGDLLGEDPAGRAQGAAEEATSVVAETLPAHGTVHLSYGTESADEYVRQLAADHLVHGWDLAMATGQDPALDAELVDDVMTWFADREEMYRSSGVVGARGPTYGDPQSALLAGFGRDARWAAPS